MRNDNFSSYSNKKASERSVPERFRVPSGTPFDIQPPVEDAIQVEEGVVSGISDTMIERVFLPLRDPPKRG
jgi:hypothetical protein